MKTVDELPARRGFVKEKSNRWNFLLDGRVYLFETDDLIKGNSQGTEGSIRAFANDRGYRLKARRRPEGLYIQVVPREEPTEEDAAPEVTA